MEKRLHRNEHDKVVAGVASGLADYMQTDVTVIRLLFILSTIFIPTSGALVYVILWIVLPVNNDLTAKYNQFNDYFKKNNFNDGFANPADPFTQQAGPQTKWNTPNAGPDFKQTDMNNFSQKQQGSDTGRTIGGLVLLLLGIYFLLKQFDILPEFFDIWKIYKLWPLAIVAVGISLIFRNQRKSEWETFKKETEEAQKAQAENPVGQQNASSATNDSQENNTVN